MSTAPGNVPPPSKLSPPHSLQSPAVGIDIPKAVLCMATAILLFSTMNALIKLVSNDYPLSQIIFARSFFSLVVLTPLIARAGGIQSLRTNRPWGHLWRCAAGVTAMTCGFTAIIYLPLANAAAFGFTAPLFTTLLGVLILGERVRWRRTLAIIIGFTGVLIMLSPDLLRSSAATLDRTVVIGSILGLTGAAMAALAMISIRRLSSTEPSTTIVFYFMLAGTLGSGAILPFQFVMPTLMGGLMLVTIGIIGGIAQMLLTQAYRQAPVAVIAPFDYTAMLWATLWGYLLWDQLPENTVFVGATIVIVSGAYITFRELKLGVASAPPTKIRSDLP